MYSKMNTLALVGLLAGGAMAASATAASAMSSATMMSSAAMMSTLTSSSAAAVTAYSKPADPSSLGFAKGNGSAPVWAYYNVSVTSVVVVQELTTLCEEATTLTFNDCEYPATKGEVVVVTNCPCTVTTTVPTLTSSYCPPGVTPPETWVKPAPPPATPTVIAPASTPSAYTTIPIQVGAAAPAGSGNAIGLIIAAVAVVFGI